MAPARSLTSCAAALVLAAGAAVPCWALDTTVPGTEVRLRNGPVSLPALRAPEARAAALAGLAHPDGPRRVMVQFDGPVSLSQRDELSRAGMRLLAPLGDFAFFASIDEAGALRADIIAAQQNIRALSRIEQAWKLHADLLAGAPPEWSVVDGKDPLNPTVAVQVMFHPDAAMDVGARALAGVHGGELVGELVSAPVMILHIPAANIHTLAADDSVQWIEPPLPFLTGLALRNDSNRAITGADIVHAEPYGLTGAGVVAFVFDGGTARATHNTFGGRLTTIDSTTQSRHATHVAGTVGGDGSGSANNQHRGMAPGVTLLSAGLGSGGSLPSGWLYTNPVDIEQDYNLAINTHGANISNNSIGTNVESNGFSCSWQGDYNITDILIDNIVRGSLGAPFRIVWAAGNERQGSRCNVEGHGQYYSIAPPSGAKNHLSIGALNSNNDSMTTFSSWGPTDDGRMKPDFAGPGCQSGGDNGVTSASNTSNTAYTSLCGTSMASPTVCGLAALLIQDYRSTFAGFPDPRNSTLKAIFAHTAHDVINPGPDYQTGYGSIRIQPAIEQLRSGLWDESTVQQGEVVAFQLPVSGGEPLKVTIAWDDFPGTPNAAVVLVNDLDLRLVDPNGNTHFPWTLDPQNPAADAVRTGPNRRDNLEQVYVDNPVSGMWTVEVVGFNVPQGPQPFSIAGAGLNAVLRIATVGPAPEYLAPGSPVTIQAEFHAVNQEIVADSPTLHVRIGEGEFQQIAMAPVSGSLYGATIPALSCGGQVSFFFTAEGETSGESRLPLAPGSSFTSLIGSNDPAFLDSFDTDQGWTVLDIPAGTGTFTGTWERAIPVTVSGAPTTDFDGDGWCYVTDNRFGNFDVDHGTTILTSPRMDATGGEATVSYARWFYNSIGTQDVLLVEISGNDGASWTVLESVGPLSTNGWGYVTLTVPPALATENFRIRFTTSDLGTQGVVEAAVDAFALRIFQCDNPPACPADWNGDTVVNSSDLSAFITSWLDSVQNGNLNADFNTDGFVNSSDLSAFITAWLAAVQNGC